MPSPHALYSVAEIRAVEQAALAALPAFTLMQRAGQAAAKRALELVGPHRHHAPILVLAGPGNNGGDALEAATHLAREGASVTVLLFADSGRQSEDSRRAHKNAKNSPLRFADPACREQVIAASRWSLIVDGLFGIGLTRAISAPLRSVIEQVNNLDCKVLALDVPSGLDADTGNIVGTEGIAIRATDTVTFIGGKPGLHTGHGRDYAGRVEVADLDIGREFFVDAKAQLNRPELFSDYLRPRPHNSHKGSFGDVIVAGGAHGMSGAAILAARAAAKCGAGRVFAAFLSEPPAYDSAQPELMCRHAHDMDFASSAVTIGPGLGTSNAARDILTRALLSGAPLVIDADALNLIASSDDLRLKLRSRGHPALLTPHPLEAARLLNTSAARVQADRLAAARQLAAELNSVVLLKGSGTIVAQPGGELAINTTGNPALATAGTGDVLAGICGALLAQGWKAWAAALAGCWLHGSAADTLVAQGTGPIGLTASELIPCVRALLNRLSHKHGVDEPSNSQ
ncbi:MAG: NAD(P)H-hydrate dehydratase [Bacillota bacterium]